MQHNLPALRILLCSEEEPRLSLEYAHIRTRLEDFPEFADRGASVTETSRTELNLEDDLSWKMDQPLENIDASG